MTALSIIIPTLNEADGIIDALNALSQLRADGVEVIVADGGSEDRTVELARSRCDKLIEAPRGRGAQMNTGAQIATGEVFLFLHADTRLPQGAECLVTKDLAISTRTWGRFDVAIAGRSFLLPVIACLINWRSRLTGIATGDQAIFVKRGTFWRVGGFPDVPLMEDIIVSRRLRQISAPLCLSARVVTSGRRWDERGPVRTILLMWRLRAAHFLGADPHTLARAYGYAPREP
ncbi:MAG: TIGR04283 family arsenosugar biosynthesis glycosyltransferase [Xanthobacteraceae bacterium]|nr:TIGR04283 family arsenosugar biosynthesis glycosyltransferase [Xanthobacteraceae bacterium]